MSHLGSFWRSCIFETRAHTQFCERVLEEKLYAFLTLSARTLISKTAFLDDILVMC